MLPTRNTGLRRSLEEWFETEDLHPIVTGEFEDPALLTAFGSSGRAVFPAPSAIAREVCRHHRVAVVGRTAAVCERYFAISVERRIKHPAVAITSAARTRLFG
jgi:LysR family transcriptional activator of nhaA